MVITTVINSEFTEISRDVFCLSNFVLFDRQRHWDTETGFECVRERVGKRLNLNQKKVHDCSESGFLALGECVWLRRFVRARGSAPPPICLDFIFVFCISIGVF